MTIKPITEYRAKRKYATSRRATVAALKKEYAGNCIYVVSDSVTGCVKIGFTRSLYQRLRTLQTTLPLGSKLEGAIFIKEDHLLKRLELTIHSNAERLGKRIGGEWFSIQADLLGHLMRESCILVGATLERAIGVARLEEREMRNAEADIPDFVNKTRNMRIRKGLAIC